jgi:hypothetical protein
MIAASEMSRKSHAEHNWRLSGAAALTRGCLHLADRGLMPASVLRVGRTWPLLRDRYGSTDGRTARDIGPGGNQLGNQSENHAADLREDTHPFSDLLPLRKSYARNAR